MEDYGLIQNHNKIQKHQVSANKTATQSRIGSNFEQPLISVFGDKNIKTNNLHRFSMKNAGIDLYKDEEFQSLCVNNGIDIEDLRQSKFIENVLGCTTDELPDCMNRMDEVNAALAEVLGETVETFNITDNNLENEPFFKRLTGKFFNALGALKNKVVHIFKKDDIESLISKTRDVVTRNFGQRNAISDLFRQKQTTTEFLVSEGYLDKNDVNDDAKVKAAFEQYALAKKPADNASVAEKQQYMKDMKCLLSDVIRDTKNSNAPEEMKYIAYMINTIAAGDRERAGEILISECGQNLELKSCVACYLFAETNAIAGTADLMGEIMSTNDQVRLSTCTTSNMLESDHRFALTLLNNNMAEFMKNNPGLNIQSIRDKVARGEALTQAELTYYAYANQYAGSEIGTYLNLNLTYDYKVSAATSLFDAATAANLGEDLMQTIKNWVINSNNMSLCGISFDNFMNRVTGNQYGSSYSGSNTDNDSKKAENNDESSTEDKKRTDKSEQKDDRKTNDKENAEIEKKNKSKNDLSKTKTNYKYKNEATVTNSVKQDNTKGTVKELVMLDKANASEQTEEDAQVQMKNVGIVAYVQKKGNEGIRQYRKENGDAKTIAEIFNNADRMNNSSLTWAETCYKQNPDIQKRVILMLSEQSLTPALKLASNDTILSLKNKKLNSFYATKLLQDEQKEREERLTNQNVA